MDVRAWFSHPVSYAAVLDVEKGEAVAAAQQGAVTATTGSFVSPDSLATFSGGALAISAVWGVLNHFVPDAYRMLTGALLCLLYGTVLYILDETDPSAPAVPPRPRRPYRIIAAVVNTCMLFSATFGAVNAVGAAHPSGGA